MDYKKVFGSPEGERVLSDLMSLHHVNMAHDAPSEKLHFIEGQRYVVLAILKRLRTNPDKLREMMKKTEEDL
jgi:hypothetical protein